MAKLSNDIKKIVKEFFSHDYDAVNDEKIVELFFYFREHANDFSIELLRELLCYAAYGVYWRTIEYMHRNKAPLPANKIKMVADTFRINSDFLQLIMDKFDLFRTEDDAYINDRILRNFDYRESKSEKNQEAANARWLLSAFNTCYEKEFGEKPILSSEEIEKLKTYNNQIEDLKSKLPDILYTLKNLKFDTDMTFKPCANWLLAKNNLGKLINGEFGKLKHKKTEKEIKAEERQRQEQEQLTNQPNEFEMAIDSICNKIDAIEFIQNYQKDSSSTMIIPPLKSLMKKFDITKDELEVQ